MASKGWISVEENQPARRAVLRQILAIKKSRPVPLVVIRGKEGSGKSRLIEEGLARLMEVVPGASYRILEPTEIERSLKSPHSEWYEGRELAQVDWLILENLTPLPANREERLCNLLDQRKRRGGAVFITTRSPWQEIATTARLASRLCGGICVGLEPWSEASRRKWLGKLMLQGDLTLTKTMVRFLSKTMPQLPGEMEAYANKWVTAQKRKGSPLTLADFKEPAKALDKEEILEKVAQKFGVTVKQLRGKGREKKLTQARNAAVWLLRKKGGFSLATIGETLGGRDHSTISNGLERATTQKRSDRGYSKAIQSIQSLI